MIKKQAAGFKALAKIKRLYKKAFPLAERKPFGIIRRMQKRGKADIWYYENEGAFVGFATTINGEDAVLVDYLAVDRDLRGKGFGKGMLFDLRDTYGKERLFLEIESPDTECNNKEERFRRKGFYLAAGMSEVGVTANIFGTDMELLSFGYTTDFEGYREFYRKNYSEFAALHIAPPTGKIAPVKKRKNL